MAYKFLTEINKEEIIKAMTDCDIHAFPHFYVALKVFL